jgi:ELWxxDGT repeat protein
VPQQLGELSPGTASSHPTHPVPVGTRLFFRANDGVHGTDLWVSDGTEAGTTLVKDLHPALGTANIWPMTGLQNRLLFTITTAPDKYELWSSDGGEAGTWYLGPINSFSGRPFVALEGQLYFVRGSSLWGTDGTVANTRQIRNFGGGSVEVMALAGAPFIIQRGVGAQLWKSDGTEAGTTVITHLPGAIPETLTTQDHLFLHYVDSSLGAELWMSDGTAAGTRLLKDIAPGAASSSPHFLGTLGNRAFFMADDGVHGRELWVSDGTEAGTRLVQDISSGRSSSNPTYLATTGNKAFFVADDGVHGQELWVSDGTEAGTRLVQDFVPGPGGVSVSSVASGSDALVFSLHSPEASQVWRSDGTEAGTELLGTISSGAPGTLRITPSGQIFLLAGNTLWRSNGSAGSLSIVRTLSPDRLFTEPNFSGGEPLLAGPPGREPLLLSLGWVARQGAVAQRRHGGSDAPGA